MFVESLSVMKPTNTFVHNFTFNSLINSCQNRLYISKSRCLYTKIHLDAIIVKCLVTTQTNVVDTMYAAIVPYLNIVDHLACVKKTAKCVNCL